MAVSTKSRKTKARKKDTPQVKKVILTLGNSEVKVHTRHYEILRVLAKHVRMTRSDLQKRLSFGIYVNGKKGCGSSFGRYLGMPHMSKSSKYQYHNTLLDLGLVKMFSAANPDNPEGRKVEWVEITKAGKKALV